MSVNILKSGIVRASDFSNFIINPLDLNYYVEPDNSVWIRLVHHNNPASVRFANNNTFTTSVYIDVDRWFNAALCYKTTKWELMIKQKPLSTDAEEKYRWIQNVNPMATTYEDVTVDKITRITTSSYINPNNNYAGIYVLNSNTYIVCANGTKGNWFCALGCWSVWNNGLPGYNGKAITTGYIDLYLRVDNDPKTSTSIFNNSIASTDFIEV